MTFVICDSLGGCGGSTLAGFASRLLTRPLGLSLACAAAAACQCQSDEAAERAQQGQVRVLSGGATCEGRDRFVCSGERERALSIVA
jgi:hypothetical protein